ncbi:MAG: T6SS effector amidase Tae4 family protein [Bacteroidota bacterium]
MKKEMNLNLKNKTLKSIFNKNDVNSNYILDAVSFDKFMRHKFGNPIYELTGADANDLEEVTESLEGKNGIYVIINSSHSQAGYSGHVDAIIDGECISNAYATPNGGVKTIAIWELD